MQLTKRTGKRGLHWAFGPFPKQTKKGQFQAGSHAGGIGGALVRFFATCSEPGSGNRRISAALSSRNWSGRWQILMGWFSICVNI